MNDATERLLRARVRPTRGPVMRQRWDDLFFLHWTYSAEAIQRRLPAGLTVDTFAGQAYLGVCPPQIDPAFRRFHAATAGMVKALQRIAGEAEDLKLALAEIGAQMDSVRMDAVREAAAQCIATARSKIRNG